MKTFSLSILSAFVLQVGLGQEVHPVPVGSRGNSIVLTVANESNTQATGALEVRLVNQSRSILMGQSVQPVSRLGPGHEVDCSFSFEVKRDAAPGRTDTLRFLIVDKERASTQEKLIVLSYAGPKEYRLFQNYPNPFNPRTLIAFDLPEEARLSLKVYDLLGREVRVLADEERPAGCYDVPFEATNIASGVYFYRLIAEPKGGGKAFADVKKLMLLK